MDRKITAIAILSLTALILLLGNFLVRNQAVAATAVSARDFQTVTVRNQTGSESLFVLDNKTGIVAVFQYDNVTRTVKPQAARLVSDAFISK